MNNSGIFNLGSGKKTTTLEFCEEYCRLNKIRSSNLIEYKSRKTRKGIWASMSKTRKKFLFKKTIKLNLGIKKALEEFFKYARNYTSWRQRQKVATFNKNLPKPLVQVNNKKPFLFYLIKQLDKFGFKEVVILAGYKSRKFKNFEKILKVSLI